MLQRIEKIIFFLIVFFIISQFGKHFWPQFSYISGIQLDYLSPTLYLTDIFIGILFFIQIYKLIRLRRVSINSSLFAHPIVFLFLLIIGISAFSALSPQAASYGIVKTIEFFFFGWYVSRQITKETATIAVDILSAGAFVVSLLAIWQFAVQRSVGGLWYFLGERTFNASTIGIAIANLSDNLFLRPYATFPHPNVLAFFLFISLVFIFFRFPFEKDIVQKISMLTIAVLANISLFLTFSRTVLLCYLVFLVWVGIRKFLEKKRWFIIPTIILLLFYFSFFSPRFFNISFLLRDWLLRANLIEISFALFQKYPLLGVGINNFFIHEISYQKTISPTLLQPVHNIYLLMLVQVGIVGFVVALWFLLKTFRGLVLKIKSGKDPEVKEFYRGVLIVFIAVLFVGLFDHFFLTLQQGQLMFALVLGLAWSRPK